MKRFISRGTLTQYGRGGLSLGVHKDGMGEGFIFRGTWRQDG